MVVCCNVSSFRVLTRLTNCLFPPKLPPRTASSSSSSLLLTRRDFSLNTLSATFTSFIFVISDYSCKASAVAAAASISEFFELEGSGGVKALDLRVGDGEVPVNGDQVAIHYYGRLAAKQGWRFDSTYDHKDEMGEKNFNKDLEFFDRQRLFTTIFNPTRLANGEGSTLGTLIFDIELVRLRRS
ncbi:PREDICTED: peptidyl-prolyl cis-trans isomerase FKBP17-1, chloroplastic isoform X4 [Nelumbo nucifera]|uniref:Peptidyl-prolyl cis-trans isomerase FKBP17-1, chloroplastic isoform X4 n=1 Tax=Nelumbo nucifera TaxID=4432 RepID=A0A1U7YVY6_NELNU|nr:PREDICTED: peptidyl-prolyl cis-trans isomerase FKBP17-1, chloroplastic isoform X4 [Nelumbo nucifera]